jgi:D-sedoheptulose 7-phosphate isomerase
MNPYLVECLTRYPVLESVKNHIQEAFETLKTSFENKGKLLLCGNGGSATDADHIAGELLKGFASKRPLSSEHKVALKDNLWANLQGGFKAIALPQFVALNTAYANDCDPYYTFAQLTWVLGEPGDVLWCLTTSGNSKNILYAAQVARAKQMKVITLTGASGGWIKDLSDTCICVPETMVFKVQELHLPIYHTLCLMLETTFFAE